MKVMQINSVYKFGSTGHIVSNLKDVITNNGDKCGVIYGRDGISHNEENVWRIGSTLDFRTHVLYARLTDNSGFASSKSTYKIIQRVKKFDPDLIHLHNIHGYYLNIELLFNFLKGYKKPVIWTLHDCWVFTGHCAHYDAINCQKWQKECTHCPQLKVYPRSFLKDNSFKNFYRKKYIFSGVENLYIVTPSQWLKKEVSKSFLNDYPCYVIENGIDLNNFNCSNIGNLGLKSNRSKIKILGVASVWGERKGYNDFIMLAQTLDLDNYEIIMVGVNARQKSILDKYGIVGIERTNNIKELVALYQEADLFFNPTYEDTFPTTNLEALACGTPVLTYRTGGSPESLNEQCGIVVDKGDINSVIYHLRKWPSYNFSSELCANQAGKFDKYKKFMQYYDLYTEVLSNYR